MWPVSEVLKLILKSSQLPNVATCTCILDIAFWDKSHFLLNTGYCCPFREVASGVHGPL